MILSSSLLFFALLLLRKTHRQLFDYRFQDILLKICFLLLLLPFPLIIKLIQILLFSLFGNTHELYLNNTEPLIIFSRQHFRLNPAANKLIYFIILWFVFMCIIILYRLIPYIKFSKRVTSSMENIEDERIMSLLCQKKHLLKISSTILLFKSDIIQSAFTTRIWKPVIIIPTEITYEDCELILHHELMHIKKKDILFQIISYICISLYWFNPLVYIMNYFRVQISELACDESVSISLDDLKRERYVQLILSSARNTSFTAIRYSNFFNNTLFYKERIDCIMKKKNLTKTLYPTIVTTLLVLLCCSPALASPAPQMLYFDENLSEKEFALSSDTEIDIYISDESYTALFPTILYEKQITLNNGEILPLNTQEPPNRAICNHAYTPAKITTHQKHSNGGCTLMVYDVDRCSKCGTLKNKVFSAEINYVSCPH